MIVNVAATQMECTWNQQENLNKAENLIHEAAERGANIILLQELFSTPYFCPEQKDKYFALANEVSEHPYLEKFSNLAKKLKVVLPISFFERDKNSYFNSVMIIDADGTYKGIYRKSHIPQGPGYQEKFYFSPGNTGFKVWETAYGCIGIGICWDQWFPECARSMALMGADLIFYPTAIGSEPQDPNLNSLRHWQRTMQGHAAANMTPIIASNRIGKEIADKTEMTFYGHSFISDETGEIKCECNDESEGTILHSFNIDEIRISRASWGLFRDRRPELYDKILQK
jgi:N-carbamoylputrescine amidase|tara:strand:+ start:11055 stop:11909 length:855 start_codon:yes stop_codon:yes gene_type:complete